MKLFSCVALLPAAFLSLFVPLPASAALQSQLGPKRALRVAPAGLQLAQMGDVEVYFDSYGRRILLDPTTGVVVGVEPPLRVSRRGRTASVQQRVRMPDRETASAPARRAASGPDQPETRLPASMKQLPIKRAGPDLAATVGSPENYDFHPEPLSPVSFAELKRLAAPRLAASSGKKTLPKPVAISAQGTVSPASTPPSTTFAEGSGNSRVSTTATQSKSTVAKPTAQGAPNRTIDAEQAQVTGSVHAAELMDGRGVAVPQHGPDGESTVQAQAERGDPKAQLRLASMYRGGDGVLKDDGAAAKWFRMAAEQGQAEAQYNLGLQYREGEGVLQDYVFAHMWFNLSAAQGYERAKKARSDLTEHMTPEQVAEAQRLAREWKPSTRVSVQ